jgi:type II secretory pathway pseudopilin PulG
MTKEFGSRGVLFILALILLGLILPLAYPTVAQQPDGNSTSSAQNAESSSSAAQDQQADTSEKEKAEDAKSKQEHGGNEEKFKQNDRMLFVMPNYLTAQNEAQVKPLTWKEKFTITAKGAFDPYEFVIVGVLAGIRQAENAYPAFGQGADGYGKRYGTAFADQVDGNMMVGAVFPSILRTDPRYFQLGKGGFGHRFMYAISRVFVTRKDSGGNTFNISEFFGNATAIGISTFYYPAQDHSGSSFVSGWGIQMGVDAFGNELKEFWPDIHRMIDKRNHSKNSQ